MSEVTKNISSFTQQDVAYLFKNAHVKARSTGLRVLLAPAQKQFGRVLVVTPRRSGNSPCRNRIRRRVKALFYEERFYTNGYDCVLIVHKDGIATSFENLKKLIVRTFSSISPESAPSTPPQT